MARYKNGVNGPFSGKVGNVVGAVRRGTPYMRGLPEQNGKAASQAQLDQRALFAMVVCWLKPLRLLIEVGYQHYIGSKTPMNGCVSHHLKEAVIGEAPDFSIDYAKAVFSRGELMISLVREVTVEAGGLRIKWDNAAVSVLNNDDDLATFVVYHSVERRFMVFKDVAERSEKAVLLEMPDGLEGVHCWMQYRNRSGDLVSTTVFVL